MNPRIGKMSGTMLKKLSALEQDVLVDLWELDLRPLGGVIHRFCNQVNEKSEPVVWKGQTYDAYPIMADGFELTGQGASNRPKINVSNALGFVTGAAAQYGQLIGATVLRRQVLSCFLDPENFHDGNPQADTSQEVVSKFLIERMVSMTPEAASFELASPAEADGAVIPARIMLAGVCPFAYRGEECGYAGGAVADKMDMPTADLDKDVCSHTLRGCRARFGLTAALPFGGFIGIDKTLT